MRLIAAVAVVLALVLGAYAVWEVQTMSVELQSLQLNVDGLQHELERLEEALTSLEESSSENEITVYWLQETETDFQLVPVRRQIRGPATPRRALEHLVAGPDETSSLSPTVPEGTQVLDLSLTNGQADASFSREIRDNFNWGAQLEGLLVESIVLTLTEFSDIDEVQILLEGEIIETIGGHVSVSEPLSR